MKEYDNIDNNDEEKVLKTEIELDETDYKPLDEEEGLVNDFYVNYELKDELENENTEIVIDFIPNDEKNFIHSLKKEVGITKKLDNEKHTLNSKFKNYSEKDVRYWIQQYNQYKSMERVRNHLREESKKTPSISTMKTRMKQLMGEEKYKELMKKYTFEEAKKIIELAGLNKTGEPGKILSKPEEFKGVKSKLIYQCGKCNHSWKTTLDSIINSKNWCPKCATRSRVDNQRGSIEEHQNIIIQKSGKLIGIIYEDPKEKLFNQRARFKIECEAGHKFDIRASSLKKGSWCKKCSYKVISEKYRGSFQEIQKLIEKRGGRCLSKPEDYKNQHQKLKIQCNKDHIFERRPSNLKRGDWCPNCSQGKFEKICRSFFEEMFQEKFPKERPDWLINSRGNQMELDGYNKNLGVSFEAQGEQHYRALAHFDQTLKDLEQRIEDDLTKLELCKQNNVLLIQIPYYVHPDKVQDYITVKYGRLTNKKLPKIPKIDYNKFYDNQDDQKKMDNYL
ncbi:MAG: zinc-ribbon domain-containing protein [Candidatus Hodarchaeota archaeon]